jgi:hypothetical protein
VEEQQSPARSFSVAPLWLKVCLAGTGVLVGVLEISRHGLKDWDWLWAVLLLWIIFPESVRGPLDKNMRWPWRILILIWIAACSAWFMHFWGWVPALAFAGIALVSPRQEEWLGWKAFLVKPRNVVVVLSGLTLVIWFARDTGGWVPTFCVVAAFFLLEGYTNARRSFIENLRRRSFLAVVCIAAIAAIWALWNPTFGNIAGFVAVVVLASSDVYLHTDEHQLVNP